MMTADEMTGVIAQICPMYLVVDAAGCFRFAGPTLQKLRPDMTWKRKNFFDVFDLQRPRWVNSMDDLLKTAGAKLHLQFRESPQTSLKGVLVPLPDGKGALINLSFGISVLEAVRDYDLTSADFSPTDLTIEMLYLVEAKSAAMEASRQLNLRLQGAKIAAEEQAFTDTLTGLKNRRAMDHILERLIGSGTDFALMHVDLDFFKEVNDTLGHAAGDAVLQSVARVMVECTRHSDTVARVGGDEFVIIFEGVNEPKVLEALSKRLISNLEEPVPYGGQMCKISASAGTTLSVWNAPPIAAAAMLHQADLALYAAKRAGRSQHLFFEQGMQKDEPQTATQGLS